MPWGAPISAGDYGYRRVNRDKVLSQANTDAIRSRGGDDMARRRYQRGHLFLRGKDHKVWIGKWREDVVLPDGSVHRVRKSETLGTVKDYKTRRLAERALEQRLAEANSLTYKPRPAATFSEFAKKWQADVLSQHKRSTQSADRSRIRKHLFPEIPELGELCMKDISREVLQTFVARKGKTLSPKSVRNLIALLGEMWVQAKADSYTQIDPFVSLVLPDTELINERCLSLDEMRLVIDTAAEPYKTYYWILAETGIRCGEACGLAIPNLLLDLGAIKITQKVWRGKIETVKSKKGNRLCEISPQLAEHLRGYLRSWRPNRLGLLFATGNGTPWDADLVRKRKLYPLLKKLGIERCGFHAFRHGNETVMDGEGVPMATRQNRLGHSDARTTMKYTHVISEDGRKIAARIGELLTSSPTVTVSAGNA
jgi:integrase